MPNNDFEVEPAPKPLVASDVYERVIQDPYLLHVTKHLLGNPAAGDPEYPGINWRDEMLTHVSEKYGVADKRLASSMLLVCRNVVLEEERAARSVEA